MERLPERPQQAPAIVPPVPARAVAPPSLRHAFTPQVVLALQRSAGNAAVTAMLARAVTTSGGEWDTTRYYETTKFGVSGASGASIGLRGVDITLQFKPGANVDAEAIGLTQTAQNVRGGATVPGSRSIPAADAKGLPDRKGEKDTGTQVDRTSGHDNPMYGVINPASTSLDDPKLGNAGQGKRFTDSTGTLQESNAWLSDEPRLSQADKNSRQVFETTALATRGAQAGTYYGSVRWGWTTDAKGNHSTIPLEKVSDGVPTAAFLKASQLWNAAPGSTDLPAPDVKLAKAAVSLLQGTGSPIDLPAKTRLVIVSAPAAPALGKVKVVDGPHVGAVGEVSDKQWPLIVDERA